MLREITIGQFYPVESKIHNLDPRVKIVATLLYLISLFTFRSFIGYLVVAAFLVGVVVMSKVPISYILKGLKPILFLLIFTAIMNVFFTPGIVAFEWGPVEITYQGLKNGGFMVLRLVFLIIGSSLLTYTTTPNQLTDAIEKLLAPLNKIKVPVHDFAMMMSLALRFIPILLEETNRIMNAQSARGADFEEGNLYKRLRAMVSILVPLFVSSTKRAYDLAMAMEARCYRGGTNRTKMKPLAYKERDVLGYAAMVVYFAALMVVSHFAPF